MSKVDSLRFVRAFSPNVVPKYLIEQIKKRDYEVEDFFKYQESLCTRMSPEGPTLNPFSHLYALATPENLTKGVLWFTVDPLSKNIVIQTYSMDKEYWKDGGAVQKLCDFMKDFRRKGKLKKIYWVNEYPKHTERNGFKRSRSILFEYSEESDVCQIKQGDTDMNASSKKMSGELLCADT